MIALHERFRTGLLKRNAVSRRFFDGEASRLAAACQRMASRFSRGGRLLAFGVGGGITDAQHVSVEFVHPVIVGKRALPALDLSIEYGRWVPALAGPDDIVMAFGPIGGDPAVVRTLVAAGARGAQTIALPGPMGDYAVPCVDADPFIQQEIIEILYHALWETVHVFLEHSPSAHDAGPAAFLYPFLGSREQDTTDLVGTVADSIRAKAEEDERLREEIADRETGPIVEAVQSIQARLRRGGKLLLFGNGGSATDATDWALDCVASPKSDRPIPAVSLSAEPATMSAIANDVGQETVFLRQLIAHGRPDDVAVAITTSGGSANVTAALVEARRQGLLTLALTGYDGGEIRRHRLADITIVVRSDYIPRIQEIHAAIYHGMIDLLNDVPAPV